MLPEQRRGVVVVHNNHIRGARAKRERFQRLNMWNVTSCTKPLEPPPPPPPPVPRSIRKPNPGSSAEGHRRSRTGRQHARRTRSAATEREEIDRLARMPVWTELHEDSVLRRAGG